MVDPVTYDYCPEGQEGQKEALGVVAS